MASPAIIAAFEKHCNEMLKEPGGQQRLIDQIKLLGAPVDPVELLETLENRGAVLMLTFLPMPDGGVFMMAVRQPSMH